MQAGNAHYRRGSDIPNIVPVFPLSAALLLPGGRMPLNIFEPRYLQMIDEAMAGPRLIGMIQPSLDGAIRDRKSARSVALAGSRHSPRQEMGAI